jgi:mono/diheme cytochrome c family protein
MPIALRSVPSTPSLGIVAGLVALAMIAAPARAQDGAKVPPPDTTAITDESVASGRKVFHGAGGCHNCHGEQLEGTPVAPTLRAHKWKDAVGGTFPEIYRVISTGVAGTAMVPRPGRISDAQVLAVASYIWTVNNRGAKP